MGILPQHVPTLGVFQTDGAVKKFFVSSGSYSVTDDGAVMIAAEEALTEDEVDTSAAKAALAEYQGKLNSGSEIEKAEAQIAVETLEALLK